jgi:hypothetical protein
MVVFIPLVYLSGLFPVEMSNPAGPDRTKKTEWYGSILDPPPLHAYATALSIVTTDGPRDTRESRTTERRWNRDRKTII